MNTPEVATMSNHEKRFSVGRSEALQNDRATGSEHAPAVRPCEAPPPATIPLVGAAHGKELARAFFRAGHVGHYTPAVTGSYEGVIRTAAMDAMGRRLSIDQRLSTSRVVELSVGIINRSCVEGYAVTTRWCHFNVAGQILGCVVGYDRPANGVTAAKQAKPFTFARARRSARSDGTQCTHG